MLSVTLCIYTMYYPLHLVLYNPTTELPWLSSDCSSLSGFLSLVRSFLYMQRSAFPQRYPVHFLSQKMCYHARYFTNSIILCAWTIQTATDMNSSHWNLTFRQTKILEHPNGPFIDLFFLTWLEEYATLKIAVVKVVYVSSQVTISHRSDAHKTHFCTKLRVKLSLTLPILKWHNIKEF